MYFTLYTVVTFFKTVTMTPRGLNTQDVCDTWSRYSRVQASVRIALMHLKESCN